MKKLLVLAVIPLLLVGCKRPEDPATYARLNFNKGAKVIKKDKKTMKFQRGGDVRIGQGQDDFFIYMFNQGGRFFFSHFVTKFESVTISFSNNLNQLPYHRFLFTLMEAKDEDSSVYHIQEVAINEESIGNEILFNCPYVSKETGGCYFMFSAESYAFDENEYQEWYQINAIQFNNITVTKG